MSLVHVLTMKKIGLIHSIPLISFWYDHVLRVVMGKLVTTTGDILYSAIHHAQNMTTIPSKKQKKWAQEYYYIHDEEDYTITPIKETNQGGGLLVGDHLSLLDDPYHFHN